MTRLDHEKQTPPTHLSWTVWGLGALFYLIGFYQRVAPAVMTGELMHEFGIGAAALGHLSALYFYSYVAMQIPTGILVDTWGARRLLAAGALVAAVGSLIFAAATNMVWAGVGRLLIGGSVAVAWVGLLKVTNQWFPPRMFAFVSGLALFCGIIGAVAAGVPLRICIDAFGWRPAMLLTAVLTFGACIAVWFVVRDDPTEKGFSSYAAATLTRTKRFSEILSGLGEVFRYPNTWLLMVIPGGIVGCVLTFSGLWGVPYLTTHYRMTATEAAAASSALLVAWAVGGPVFGGLSDRIGRRKRPYVVGCAAAILGWGVLLFVHRLPLPVLVGLILATGFASGCIIISFAFAKESVPPHLTGTISGLINMGIMLGPTLLQPAVGWMLDRHWQGMVIDGVRVYGLGAYRAGFALMGAWAVLSFALLLFSRETYCRQVIPPPTHAEPGSTAN